MKIIASSDEVGRGAFAGPLVAASVILNNQNKQIFQDSKKLSSKQRQSLALQIMQEHQYAIGIVSAEEIDFLGITLANLLAVIRSCENLKVKTDIVLVDGNLKFPDPKYFSIIKGDRIVNAISAASIVAKVYRDNLMDELNKEFPAYNWQQNKGYGTLEHRKQITTHGLSPYHRKSFTYS